MSISRIYMLYVHTSAIGFLGLSRKQLGPSSWPTRCAFTIVTKWSDMGGGSINNQKLRGGNSNMFYFHLYLGKWCNFNYLFFFQMGWNHQLENKWVFTWVLFRPLRSGVVSPYFFHLGFCWAWKFAGCKSRSWNLVDIILSSWVEFLFVCMRETPRNSTLWSFFVSPNGTLHWAGWYTQWFFGMFFWELRQSPTRRTGDFTGEQGGFHTGPPTGPTKIWAGVFSWKMTWDAFVNIENVVQKMFWLN